MCIHIITELRTIITYDENKTASNEDGSPGTGDIIIIQRGTYYKDITTAMKLQVTKSVGI